MNDERRRILDMLARGVITVEECEQMLGAVAQRTQEKVQRDIQDAQSVNPGIPIALIVALLAIPLAAFVSLTRGHVFVLLGAGVSMAAQGLWIWMLIDCILREPERFRLYFSRKHEIEKWVWLAIVALVNVFGAIVYFSLIYLPQRAASGGATGEARPFVPSAPARSLSGFIWAGVVLVVICVTASLTGVWMGNARPGGAGLIALSGTVVTVAIWVLAFWIWMLVDCARRDCREFGALIRDPVTDKVAWLALILLTGVLGGAAYHLVIRRHPDRAQASHRRELRRAFFIHLEVAIVLFLSGAMFNRYVLREGLGLLHMDVPVPSLVRLAMAAGDVAIMTALWLGIFGIVLYAVIALARRFRAPAAKTAV